MTDNVQLVKREFIHGCYTVSRFDKSKDCVFVKEIIHNANGQTQRRLTPIINYQRPFYITKPEYRDYEDKKEYEPVGRLDKYHTNQAQLATQVFKILKGYAPSSYVSMYDLSSSPYIYGTDVSTPVLLANEYRTRWPGLSSPCTLAVMDYETDVLNGTEDIISGVLSFKDRVHIAVTTEFLGHLASRAKDDILAALNLHLKEYIVGRNITPTITICSSPGKVVMALMKSAHEWAPDYLGFWNISFDMNKMLKVLKQENMDPAFIFSDPSVPEEFRYFKWKEAELIKLKSDGKSDKKHYADLWHKVSSPASFQCICLMALFKIIRDREQQRVSYSLDAVLTDYVELKKMKFEGMAEGLTRLDWHIEMQRFYKIEYLVYMTFDGISCEILDEKTGDVSKTLKGCVGLSELSNMKSNPKRLADDMHFTLLGDNKVIGSTSKDMTTPLCSYLPSLNDWIVALSSELEYKIGRCLINEYPTLETNITTDAFDIDVKSGYPTIEICCNISKTTKQFELCKIKGFSTDKQRSIGINMTSVKTNALSLANTCYGFPSLDKLLSEFQKVI